MANVQNEIVAFVKNYVEANNRGCPKGVLIHVGGFKAKDILETVNAGLLESGRGSEGGLFPIGEKPSPKATVNVTLKSRMVDALRVVATGGTLDATYAATLVAEYEEELKRRSESQN